MRSKPERTHGKILTLVGSMSRSERREDGPSKTSEMQAGRYTLVSVVMLVRNGTKYLAKSIRSILLQTLDDFEFLILDDGSSDETPRVLLKALALAVWGGLSPSTLRWVLRWAIWLRDQAARCCFPDGSPVEWRFQ